MVECTFSSWTANRWRPFRQLRGGRSVAADEGELVAALTGSHGWFWRNRGSADAKVVLRTRGDYSEIKRVK